MFSIPAYMYPLFVQPEMQSIAVNEKAPMDQPSKDRILSSLKQPKYLTG